MGCNSLQFNIWYSVLSDFDGGGSTDLGGSEVLILGILYKPSPCLMWALGDMYGGARWRPRARRRRHCTVPPAPLGRAAACAARTAAPERICTWITTVLWIVCESAVVDWRKSSISQALSLEGVAEQLTPIKMDWIKIDWMTMFPGWILLFCYVVIWSIKITK